jgi:hypothetical protein
MKCVFLITKQMDHKKQMDYVEPSCTFMMASMFDKQPEQKIQPIFTLNPTNNNIQFGFQPITNNNEQTFNFNPQHNPFNFNQNTVGNNQQHNPFNFNQNTIGNNQQNNAFNFNQNTIGNEPHFKFGSFEPDRVEQNNSKKQRTEFSFGF